MSAQLLARAAADRGRSHTIAASRDPGLRAGSTGSSAPRTKNAPCHNGQVSDDNFRGSRCLIATKRERR